jgi:hypothetical protein
MKLDPPCTGCIHLQGKAICGRPVPSYWNPATNQRRSRVASSIEMERSDRKVLGSKRVRCGPQGRYFEAPFPAAKDIAVPEVSAHRHDTIGDSDGDDGS